MGGKAEQLRRNADMEYYHSPSGCALMRISRFITMAHRARAIGQVSASYRRLSMLSWSRRYTRLSRAILMRDAS